MQAISRIMPFPAKTLRPEELDEELHLYARLGVGEAQKKGVQSLISKGARVTSIDHFGRGLALNIVLGNTVTANLMELLLHQNGVDPDFVASDGRTALHAAAVTGGLEYIDALLSFGAQIEKRTAGGETAIELAARYGQGAAVRLLARRGADTGPLARFRAAHVSEECWAAVSAAVAGQVPLERIERKKTVLQVEREAEEARREKVRQALEAEFAPDEDEDDLVTEIDPHCLHVTNQRIGNGSYSEVFRGTFVSSGKRGSRSRSKPVAVKRFKVGFDASAPIEAEARFLHKYRGPNLAGIIGTCEIHRSLCIVMPLYTETLAKWLARRPPGRQPNRASEFGLIAGGIARAMEHLHARGVSHRDLKPENVLLDGNLVPHVADFGHAILLEGGAGRGPQQQALTSTRTVGTPLYCAPEINREHLKDSYNANLADIFSYGAILYTLLSGALPVLKADKTVGFPLLDDTSLFPAVLKALIEDCTRDDPAGRIQSFTAVLQRIRAYLLPNPKWESYLVKLDVPTDNRLFDLPNLRTLEDLYSTSVASRSGAAAAGSRAALAVESTTLLPGVTVRHTIPIWPFLKVFAVPVGPATGQAVVTVQVVGKGGISVGANFGSPPGPISSWDIAAVCTGRGAHEVHLPCDREGIWYIGAQASISLFRFTAVVIAVTLKTSAAAAAGAVAGATRAAGATSTPAPSASAALPPPPAAQATAQATAPASPKLPPPPPPPPTIIHVDAPAPPPPPPPSQAAIPRPPAAPPAAPAPPGPPAPPPGPPPPPASAVHNLVSAPAPGRLSLLEDIRKAGGTGLRRLEIVEEPEAPPDDQEMVAKLKKFLSDRRGMIEDSDTEESDDEFKD